MSLATVRVFLARHAPGITGHPVGGAGSTNSAVRISARWVDVCMAS